jgi:hypothetical protein
MCLLYPNQNENQGAYQIHQTHLIPARMQQIERYLTLIISLKWSFFLLVLAKLKLSLKT